MRIKVIADDLVIENTQPSSTSANTPAIIPNNENSSFLGTNLII